MKSRNRLLKRKERSCILFIDEVMTKLWQPEAHEYQRAYQQAMALDAEELYTQLTKSEKLSSYRMENKRLSFINSPGCTYHLRDGQLSGCSMCNLHTKDCTESAKIQALREKDVTLYAKMIQDIILKSKEPVNVRNVHEFIYSHNFLNSQEVPDEVLEVLFGKNGVFQKRPLVYEFETSALSVSKERLESLKSYVGSNGIWIRLGVECRDEWLRNHWINKNLTDKQLETAIQLCHTYGFKVTTNILLGIPGLTEMQSVREFSSTVGWLLDLGTDMISCSILSRKPYTLQHYLYSSLAGDSSLQKAGIVYGEHTGLPWLFTAISALNRIYRDKPDCRGKITMGQFEPEYLAEENQFPYNAEESCDCNRKIKEELRLFAFDQDWQRILSLSEAMTKDPCYWRYSELLSRQATIDDDVTGSISLVGRAVCRQLWPTGWQEKYRFFFDEIMERVHNNQALYNQRISAEL